jgi:hypothetical protein
MVDNIIKIELVDAVGVMDGDVTNEEKDELVVLDFPELYPVTT